MSEYLVECKRIRDRIDRYILGAITIGRHDFVEIWRYSGWPKRRIERRLQALRKAGKITNTRADGWHLKETT